MSPHPALQPADLRASVAAFARALDAHKEVVNRLNVYPVPDGDTGTNMALTLRSVLEEAEAAGDTMTGICKAISHGSLMGARGNSGVILSQVLRGLASTFEDVEEIDGPTFSTGLSTASRLAYDAVMTPVEGTILTVVRESAEAAAALVEAGQTELVTLIEAALAAGHDALERTPEMLPVLAEAGVVDAGGTGYLLFYDAVLHVLDGRALPDPPVDAPVAAASFDRPDAHDGHGVGDTRYEVMFFLDAPDDTIGAFRDVWAGLGDSIVVVGGDGIWNCHIHTNDIGPTIEAGIAVGTPSRIRVTDLAEEVAEERWVREGAAAEVPAPPADPVPCAVVAVSPAAGIGRIFHSLGVQQLVTGGQTMNPSTADLLAAVEAAPADEVVVLPNNKNIIAVAEQVDAETAKTVRVVPTTSVTEGFASLLAYDPQAEVADNAAAMAAVASDVVTGEITQAVRDTTADGKPVTEGDWLGIDRVGVQVVAPSVGEACTGLLDRLVTPFHEIITLIEGADATAGDTRTITEWVAEHRAGAAVEVHRGGQPHYPYLFGIE